MKFIRKINQYVRKRVTCRSPFTADTESKLRDQIRKAEIDTQSISYLMLSPEAKDCLSRMIKVNPAHRITSSELIDHPWFLDKKLDEMSDKQKNVLELMTDFLNEQENKKNTENGTGGMSNTLKSENILKLNNILNGDKLETHDSSNNTSKSNNNKNNGGNGNNSGNRSSRVKTSSGLSGLGSARTEKNDKVRIKHLLHLC